MDNYKKEKDYQFVKMCSALTKQGFKFTKQDGVSYALVFDKVSAKRLSHPDTKIPFEVSQQIIAIDKTRVCIIINQWVDKKMKRFEQYHCK